MWTDEGKLSRGQLVPAACGPPQTGPLISTREGLPLSFSSPSLQSNFKVSDFLLWHEGSRRKTGSVVIRDRRVEVSLLLAR